MRIASNQAKYDIVMAGKQLCQFNTIYAALLTFNLSTLSVSSIAFKFHYMRAIIERLRDT